MFRSISFILPPLVSSKCYDPLLCPTFEGQWPSGGNMNFVDLSGAGASCGNGEHPYVGLISPVENTEPDKLFIDLMGGAVCFNSPSCNDYHWKPWLGVDSYLLSHHIGGAMNAGLISFLKNYPVPTTMISDMKPGYLPLSTEHPYGKRKGVWVFSCTLDLFVGMKDCEYDGETVRHRGGVIVRKVVDALHNEFPDVTEIALSGGSGGAVAAVAWSEIVAELWPTATVRVMADSMFHVTPASTMIEFFYTEACWRTTVVEKDLEMNEVPSLDWRSKDALSNVLHKFDGRVKFAFLACLHDSILSSDRIRLVQYSQHGERNLSFGDPEEEVWSFLNQMHKAAPAGTVFSYVSNGTCHHQLREQTWLAENALPGTITQQEFVENFLNSGIADPSNPTQQRYWFSDEFWVEPKTKRSRKSKRGKKSKKRATRKSRKRKSA